MKYGKCEELCVASLLLVVCSFAACVWAQQSDVPQSSVQCCYESVRTNMAGQPVHATYAFVDLSRTTTEVPSIPSAAGGCSEAFPNPAVTAESWDLFGTVLQHRPTLIVNANHFLYPSNPHEQRCLNATGYMYGQNREAHAAGDTINKGPYPQALPDTLLFLTHVDNGPLVSIAPRPEASYKAPQGTIAAVSGTMIVQNRQNTSDRAQLKNIEWNEPAARTAVGILPDRRHIIVAVVEGDLVPAMGLPGRSIGISLPELGQWMIELGAVDVMNLDGGGSSFFLYRQPPLYQTLNQVKDKFPNGSQGRQVRPTSTLLIFEDGGPVALQAQRLEGVPTPAGCTVSHTAGSLSAAGSYTINRNGELQLNAATVALQPKTSVLMEIPGQPARTAFHAGPPTAALANSCTTPPAR